MKTWKVFIALIFLLWITGCWTTTGPAVLRLSLDISGQRTILPEVNPESYSITISNGVDEYVFNSANSNPSFEIEPGIWDVSVEGLDSSDEVIAVGIVEDVLVSSGNTTDVSVSLTATMTGTGSIDVTVDWSNVDAFSINNVTATLNGDNVELDEIGESASYQDSVPSGNYSLLFALSYGESSQISVSEAVQVFDNLVSSAVILLSNEDFTSVPSTPESLSATTVSSSRIDLSWTDTSHNEAGFIIERSLDNNTFDEIKRVDSPSTVYSDNGLASDKRYYYRVMAYNTTGISEPSNVDDDVTLLNTEALIIDHNSVPLFDYIPQEYIEEVKKALLILPGESHGRAYGYGLELLENDNPLYNSKTNWEGAAESYTDQHLRWNRAFLDGEWSWNKLMGEKDFWTNDIAIDDVITGLQIVENDYSGSVYFGFGWCWDMTWHNNPTVVKDPEYKCGWAGSSVGGIDGDLPWGIDDDDNSITGNTLNLGDYLEAVDTYTSSAPSIKTIFTTGPVDGNTNNENGFQRHLKHEAIREYVTDNGGILFDYADILSWDYDTNQPFLESWTDDDAVVHTWNGRNPDLATGGSGYDGGDGGDGGSHISEEACLILGKAIWVMLALDSGWDGN